MNFFHLLPPWSIAPVVWDVDDWRITFNAVPDAARFTEEVEATGGYAITHVVRIERQDAAGFSIDDFKALSEGLRRFLSFVQGRWIGLVLPVGYDSGEQAVWRNGAPGEWTHGNTMTRGQILERESVWRKRSPALSGDGWMRSGKKHLIRLSTGTSKAIIIRFHLRQRSPCSGCSGTSRVALPGHSERNEQEQVRRPARRG